MGTGIFGEVGSPSFGMVLKGTKRLKGNHRKRSNSLFWLQPPATVWMHDPEDHVIHTPAAQWRVFSLLVFGIDPPFNSAKPKKEALFVPWPLGI